MPVVFHVQHLDPGTAVELDIRNVIVMGDCGSCRLPRATVSEEDMLVGGAPEATVSAAQVEDENEKACMEFPSFSSLLQCVCVCVALRWVTSWWCGLSSLCFSTGNSRNIGSGSRTRRLPSLSPFFSFGPMRWTSCCTLVPPPGLSDARVLLPASLSPFPQVHALLRSRNYFPFCRCPNWH